MFRLGSALLGIVLAALFFAASPAVAGECAKEVRANACAQTPAVVYAQASEYDSACARAAALPAFAIRVRIRERIRNGDGPVFRVWRAVTFPARALRGNSC